MDTKAYYDVWVLIKRRGKMKKRSLKWLQLIFVPGFLILLGLFGFFEQWFGWSDGPLGLHYGVWFACYLSYLIIIGTTLYYYLVREKQEQGGDE